MSEDKVLDFLENDDSKEKEISASNWISTNDGKEDTKEISSEAEKNDQ